MNQPVIFVNCDKAIEVFLMLNEGKIFCGHEVGTGQKFKTLWDRISMASYGAIYGFYRVWFGKNDTRYYKIWYYKGKKCDRVTFF